MNQFENLNSEFNKFLSSTDFKSLANLLLATLFVIFIIYFLNYLSKKLEKTISYIKSEFFKDIKFKEIILLSKENLESTLDLLLNISKLSIKILVLYGYAVFSFSLFPVTQGIATKLLSYVIQLGSNALNSVIFFIPNLISIFMIIFVTYQVLKFGRILSRSLYFRQTIFRGFKQEWIIPTYDIAKFFIIVFAIIMVFPYLPGSDSPAFKGVSVFLGVLLTLGSSTAISNIIAGIVLIYMSPFRRGDRVKIGDVVGDISEMGLLVTRIETIKNEQVTIPNSQILSKETVNYSASAKSENNLIISVIVTIGYDVSKDTVKSLLLESSKGISDVLEDPAAFVFINELDGSYISYELNVYTSKAKKSLQIKSDLRENIIKKFGESGVEILSPQHLKMSI